MSETAIEKIRPNYTSTVNVAESLRKKKITIDSVIGKGPGKLEPLSIGTNRWLVDFYCHVTGAKLETGSYGEYNRWVGDFRAINLLTGEVHETSNIILPAIADSLVEAAYVGGNKIGGSSGNVSLAFRVGIEGDPTNKAGYRFILADIVTATRKSPLDELMEAATAPRLLTMQERQAIENQPAVEVEKKGKAA